MSKEIHGLYLKFPYGVKREESCRGDDNKYHFAKINGQFGQTGQKVQTTPFDYID